MKKYSHVQPEEKERFSSLKKSSKLTCHKNKGKRTHEWKLCVPLMLRRRGQTVEEFYIEEDKRKDSWATRFHFSFALSRFWECVHCGKNVHDTESKPKDFIRNNLYNETL